MAVVLVYLDDRAILSKTSENRSAHADMVLTLFKEPEVAMRI